MKIIDLLNKIANDEQVPKKVKYCDEIFTFNNDDCNFLYKYQVGKCQLFGCCRLNDIVEIIEENNKIEKLNNGEFALKGILTKEQIENGV